MDVYIHDGISSPFVPTWQSLALAPLTGATHCFVAKRLEDRSRNVA